MRDEFAEIPEAVRLGAVQVILSDHHFWGGFRATQNLAALCQTFGLGLSMHSNTHLGVSLAAMAHIAAATPNLTYALDTHTPWKSEARTSCRRRAHLHRRRGDAARRSRDSASSSTGTRSPSCTSST